CLSMPVRVPPTSGLRRTIRSPRSSDHRPRLRRAWRGTGRRHKPVCLGGKPCRTAHRTDSRVLPSLLPVTLAEASVPYPELVGSCQSLGPRLFERCPELRPLSSTGITQRPQYYGPAATPCSRTWPSRAVRWPALRPPHGASRVA